MSRRIVLLVTLVTMIPTSIKAVWARPSRSRLQAMNPSIHMIVTV